MQQKKNTAFIRVDILELWRFAHEYAKAEKFKELGKLIWEIAQALLANDMETNATAARLLQESIDFQNKKRKAGKLGGLAKARNKENESQQSNQPTQTKNSQSHNQKKRPPTKEQVYNFATDHKLDSEDARTWYEQNYVERPGCDKDGEVIRNWQGALINACKAAKAKREKEK